MTCPRCSSTNPDVARYCSHCGESLVSSADRRHNYAANPGEPTQALVVMTTLMPHVSGGRHHIYRAALLFAFVATMVAAAFGALAVALFCAAIALPSVLLLYQYDHEIWEDQPVTAIAVGVVLAIAAGVGVGFLASSFNLSALSFTILRQFPSGTAILKSGVILPVVAFALLVVVTGILAMRPAYSHAVDAVNFGAMVGVAFALGESLAVQHGAFGLTLSSTDPARVAFVALTLGMAKPVIYACAAALPWLQWRRSREIPSNGALGVAEGFALVLLFDLSVVLLNPYGSRGVVLIFVVAVVLAAVGLLWVRLAVHDALIAEAVAAVAADRTTQKLASNGAACAHCQMPLVDQAAFCLVCGMSVAAMPKQMHVKGLESPVVTIGDGTS